MFPTHELDIFRDTAPTAPPPSSTQNPRRNRRTRGEYNGKSSPSATQACVTWNLDRFHESHNCDDDGYCRYKHDVCDHFVTDSGPKGTCGKNHKRVKCDNPNKCTRAV